MPDAGKLAETKARLSAAGMSRADAAWFDTLGWRDGAIPVIETDEERAAYQRRETTLNAAIGGLALPDRIISLESRLAAAIGARIADYNERDEEE